MNSTASVESRAGPATTGAWWLILALAMLLGCSAPVARAQNLPSANLATFSHQQQAAGVGEESKHTVEVPAGVGAPFYLFVSTRQPHERHRIAALKITINGTEVLGAADLFRDFRGRGKRIELQATNTVHVRMAASAGVRLNLRVVGTPIPIKAVDVTPNPAALERGATATLHAKLSPTPTVGGALVAVSTRPGVAAPTSFVIRYGAGQQGIEVPVRGLSPGSATILIGSTWGWATAHVKVVTTPPAVSFVLPEKANVERGASSTLLVHLDSARATPTSVALAVQPAGVLSVPSSLTIPAGQYSANVDIAALAEGTAQVAASLGSSQATSTITVTPASSPALVSLLPPATSVTLGASAPLTATLAAARPLSATIELQATPTGIVSVPASVTIPAGQTAATFQATSLALGTALVRATLDGSSAEAAVNVVAPAPTVASLLPETLSLTTGATGTFTLGLNAAQATDTVVPLSVSDAAVLQAPANITVPAGRPSADFPVLALAPGNARLSASLNGATRGADVSVAPPAPAVVAVEPPTFSLQVGATGSANVRLNAAQPQDTPVPLSVVPPGLLQAPSSVTVPAGALTAAVAVTGLAEGVATLSAALPAGAASAIVTVTPPPTLITGLTPATLSLAKGRTGVLRLLVSPAPKAPLVALLGASSPAVTLPAQVTVPAGALGVDVPVVAANEGSAFVTATLNGSIASAEVQVTPPEVQALALSPQDATAFVGETVQFTATATLTDGTVRDETARATWASSNPAVAEVGATGAAVTRSAGGTDITATSGSASATTPLNVLPTPLLTLAPATASIKVGTSLLFTVSSSAPAEAGGLAVTLAAGGTGAVTLPAVVNIPAGQTSATFSVVGTAPGSVSLTASAPRRAPATATLSITPAITVTSITPAAGPAGTSVTLAGSGFDPVAANNRVTFTGPTPAGVVATVVTASATQLVVVAPLGAVSGPVTVTTPLGSATSPPFTVQFEQDFSLTASPAESVLLAGAATTVSLKAASTGLKPYTGLLEIAAQGLPAGVTARVPPTLTTLQNGSVLFFASAGTAPGRYDVTLQATGLTSGGRQTRAATATLVVQAAVGVTGVKGRFVTPEGQPVAGVLVRVEGAAATATDAAGNFLLTGLTPGPVTLRFDATPAHPQYPIWPFSMTLTSGQIAVLAEWTLSPPPTDDKFVPIANAAQTQTIVDARFPDFSVTLPAGTTITGWDGVPKSRIAVERIAVDKLPVPGPPVPIREAYQLYFGTPMGGIPSQPIPVSVPNVTGLDPGDQTELWYFDGSPMGGSGEWKLAGMGTISADGKRVESNPGVGIPRFCGVCGLISARCPPLPDGDPPSPECNKAGNPVELLTGAEMPSMSGLSCGGLTPMEVGLSYNPVDAFQGRGGIFGSVGQGWVLDHDVVLADEASRTEFKRLLLPPNHRIGFSRQPDGTYAARKDPRFRGAVLRLVSTSPRVWELRFKHGQVWRFGLYDATATAAFLTETIDPAGNAIQITRRTDNKRITAVGTAQRSYSMTYGANGFVQEIRDPANRTMRFTYTPANRIETITDAEGGITRYSYLEDAPTPGDPQLCSQAAPTRRIRTISYPGRPNPTVNFYGPSGRVLRQIRYDGVEFLFEYLVSFPKLFLTNVVGGPAAVWTVGYAVDSWANYQAGERNCVGTVVGTTVVQSDGSRHSKRFYPSGMAAEVDENGSLTTLARDANGQVTRRTDALGRTWQFSHDDKGNVTRQVDPLGRIVDIAYDPVWNRPTRVTRFADDGSPVSYQAEYDRDRGRLTRTTNPLGYSTTYSYTEGGQLARVTDPLGNEYRLVYTETGDLAKLTDPIGNTASLSYDAVGRVTSWQDAIGHSSTMRLTGLDRPLELVDPLGGVTRVSYDAAQRPIQVTSATNVAAERYAFNDAGQLVQIIDALGKAELLTYDSNGRLASRTDRRGNVSRFQRSPGGRVVGAQYTDGALSIGYDTLGRIVRLAQTGAGPSSILFELDTAGRVIKEVQSSLLATNTIVYEYDALDRLRRRVLNGAHETRYTWDAASRLKGIASSSRAVSYEYDAADRVVLKILPNGIRQINTFDPASRLTAIDYSRADGTPIDRITYGYGPSGRRISRSRIGGLPVSETDMMAQYDVTDRHTSLTFGSGDGSGGADRGCAISYDEEGNLLTKDCGQGRISYTWNSQNQLTGVSGLGLTAEFVYDALGRRLSRTISGSATSYIYDGPQVIAEVRQHGESAGILTGPWIDEVVARLALSGDLSFLADAVGSVVSETREDGGVAVIRGYSPYGAAVSDGATDNESRYVAREFDSTGLYYYRARYYDPTLLRFLSEDPLGLSSGVSRYVYAQGDPVGLVDPYGLEVKIVGKTPVGKERLRRAYMDLKKSKHGRSMCEKLERSGTLYQIFESEEEEEMTDAINPWIYIDPSHSPILRTTEGLKPTPLVIVLAHEMGHVLGTADSGPNRMDNVKKNENPVRRELGYPERICYSLICADPRVMQRLFGGERGY
ncbi:MAG: Ig-like domain-containing protein [Rubrivivax sp.]|nr:Ig-like domain-containing protein [Rubrivivax sp.]